MEMFGLSPELSRMLVQIAFGIIIFGLGFSIGYFVHRFISESEWG
jgi:hypothetical protein